MDRPHARHLHLLAPVWTQQLPQHSRGLRLHLGSCEWPPPPSRWPPKSGALITLKVTDTDCQRVSSVCIYWTAVFSLSLSLSLFVSCLRAQEGRWDDSPCNLTLPSICKKLGTKTDGKPQHQDCKQVLLFCSLRIWVLHVSLSTWRLLFMLQIIESFSPFWTRYELPAHCLCCCLSVLKDSSAACQCWQHYYSEYFSLSFTFDPFSQSSFPSLTLPLVELQYNSLLVLSLPRHTKPETHTHILPLA